MKILIFASPRSGSTALTIALSKCLNLKKVLEPFNPQNIKGLTEEQINGKGNNISNNKIIKVLSMHRPRKWFLNYINKFDKVIYLTRKNAKLASESFNYAQVTNGGIVWHLPYMITPDIKESRDITYTYIKATINEVKLVASLHKKSYILYEDLYSEDITVFNNIVDEIDLDLNKIELRDMLHPSKKYRQPFKPKTII